MKSFYKVTAKMKIKGEEEDIVVYDKYKSIEQAQSAIDSLRLVFGEDVMDAWID